MQHGCTPAEPGRRAGIRRGGESRVFALFVGWVERTGREMSGSVGWCTARWRRKEADIKVQETGRGGGGGGWLTVDAPGFFFLPPLEFYLDISVIFRPRP